MCAEGVKRGKKKPRGIGRMDVHSVDDNEENEEKEEMKEGQEHEFEKIKDIENAGGLDIKTNTKTKIKKKEERGKIL